MKFSINEDGNHVASFICPDSKLEESMELFLDNKDEDWSGEIEWDRPETVGHIGFHCSGKTLEGYDGVFELPKEAIQLLKHAGIEVEDDF